MKLPDRITVDAKDIPWVRGLPISVMQVNKDVRFFGLSEAKLFEKYPGLEPEDLPAIQEYIRLSIQSRDHDEITGRPILPKDKLVAGGYYLGRCRNATVARWNADENCFYHWREKFGHIYIETIKYPTDEEEIWWDVFDVVSEFPEAPFEIPFDGKAEFTGNRDDLTMFEKEMWGKWSNKHDYDIWQLENQKPME